MAARALLAVSALAAAAACSAQSQSGGARAGLYGKVVLSPATPVCRAGTPCSRPANGLTLLFSQQGRTVAKTQTNKRGRYRIALAAGRYAVHVRGHRLGSGLHPGAARVPRGRYARIDFTYDAGIR